MALFLKKKDIVAAIQGIPLFVGNNTGRIEILAVDNTRNLFKLLDEVPC